MQTSLNTKAGINIVNGDMFFTMRLLLEMVEKTLNGCGMDMEFIDVEPAAEGGIRYSILINGEEH